MDRPNLKTANPRPSKKKKKKEFQKKKGKSRAGVQFITYQNRKRGCAHSCSKQLRLCSYCGQGRFLICGPDGPSCVVWTTSFSAKAFLWTTSKSNTREAHVNPEDQDCAVVTCQLSQSSSYRRQRCPFTWNLVTQNFVARNWLVTTTWHHFFHLITGTESRTDALMHCFLYHDFIKWNSAARKAKGNWTAR
jgi:hypothetical protein